WFGATETIVASTPPKKTWTGDWKPEPMIVTRVLPSFTPEDGRTAVMTGVDGRAVPKAKQFGSESTVGFAVPLFKVTRISTGVEGELASGNPGVSTLITSFVTLTTVASRGTPSTMKRTRVSDASPPV